jgi:hypothetical protein
MLVELLFGLVELLFWLVGLLFGLYGLLANNVINTTKNGKK